MNSQLYIPTKLMVGYNRRGDTYSDLLGYVIYYDEKGVLRKEKGWREWISRDGHSGLIRRDWNEETKSYNDVYDESRKREPLPPDAYDNVPTEGFVLNRNVGGNTSWSSWHGREAKIRVWDPRGFEIEIDLPNLLFILQETNSIKGKGLEGEFVYAWEGKDLVLLPVTSQEYQNSLKFTDLKSKKVRAKELVPGYTYESKEQEKLIYLGKFDCLAAQYSWRDDVYFGKSFVFVNEDEEIILMDKTSSIAVVVSDTVIETFAELIDKFKDSDHSPYISELIEQKMSYSGKSHRGYFYNDEHLKCFLFDTPCIKDAEGEYTQYGLYPSVKMSGENGYWRYNVTYTTEGFRVIPIKKIFYKDGMISEKKITRKTSVESALITSLEEVNKMEFVTLSIKRKNSNKQFKIIG